MTPLHLHQRIAWIRRQRERDYTARVVSFIALHIPLVFLLRWDPLFATLHALFTLGLGVGFLVRDRLPNRLIYVVAYITGAELLWRGLGAAVFWEFGKYATILLLGLGLFRFRRLPSASRWPLVYFALLVPSVFLLPAFDREAIAFNLAGPFALAVVSMFFERFRLAPAQLKNVLLAILAPAVGLGVLALQSVFAANVLSFGAAYSDKLTSAGIGPNQVSSILGLGAFAAFLLAVGEDRRPFLRRLMIVLTLWLLAQSALTFSRGGFWTAIAAMLSAGFFLIRDKRSRNLLMAAGVTLSLLGYFVAFPALDELTNQSLSVRFRDFGSTGRFQIVQADLLIFQRYPLFGVGPHQSKKLHALTFRFSSAHVEYSRMLSEHGSLGLVALLILAAVIAKRFFARLSPRAKAYVVSFTVWALLYMAHSATRLVAPSLMFGLAAAVFLTEESRVPATGHRARRRVG